METTLKAVLRLTALIHEENVLIMSLLLSPTVKNGVIQSYADKYNRIVDEFQRGCDERTANQDDVG